MTEGRRDHDPVWPVQRLGMRILVNAWSRSRPYSTVLTGTPVTSRIRLTCKGAAQRLPPTSLTRKRSEVQILNRPPATPPGPGIVAVDSDGSTPVAVVRSTYTTQWGPGRTSAIPRSSRAGP